MDGTPDLLYALYAESLDFILYFPHVCALEGKGAALQKLKVPVQPAALAPLVLLGYPAVVPAPVPHKGAGEVEVVRADQLVVRALLAPGEVVHEVVVPVLAGEEGRPAVPAAHVIADVVEIAPVKKEGGVSVHYSVVRGAQQLCYLPLESEFSDVVTHAVYLGRGRVKHINGMFFYMPEEGTEKRLWIRAIGLEVGEVHDGLPRRSVILHGQVRLPVQDQKRIVAIMPVVIGKEIHEIIYCG